MTKQQSRNTRARPSQPLRRSRPGISKINNVLPLMNSSLPGAVLNLLELLGKTASERSARAFVVGGLVRDIVLGWQSLDIDVVIEGDAMQIAEELAVHAIKRPVFNRDFATATLPFEGGFHIDIATARTETYDSPGALPKVQPGTVEEDLRRRDFTINCVCASLAPEGVGDVFDPHSGLKDIEIGLIRVLHERSFVDDPTRIIRAIKYANRFKFVIDYATLELAEDAICDGCFSTISPHRLTDELRSLFVEEVPWGAVWDLAQLSVLSSISPYLSLFHNALPILQRLERLEEATKDGLPDDYRKWLVRLLLFMGNVPEHKLPSTLAIFDLDRNEAAIVEEFVTRQSEILSKLDGLRDARDSELWQLFSGISAEAAVVIVASRRAKASGMAFERYWSLLQKVRLEINGDDIKGMGVPEGPSVGEILRSVLMAKLDGHVDGKEAELALARRLAAQDDER
ncbi:MAG TPA: hypothetical protein VM163_05510 [bacterium]|nr:hypothetical protein [bacterium]